MTRKDFVLIAEAIDGAALVAAPTTLQNAALETAYLLGARNQHEELCKAIANALARTNSRFDKERFLKACGVQS